MLTYDECCHMYIPKSIILRDDTRTADFLAGGASSPSLCLA